MERDRKQELIEKKKLKNNQNSQSDKNHINISVNIGNNDNLQEDRSVNIKEEPTVKPIEQPDKKVDEDKINENEILITQLKGLIKEFNSKKQNLIDKRQDIPNDIFDLPDIELNSRQDIVNLIEVMKEKIRKLDMIILQPTPISQPSIQPSRPTTTIQTPSNIPFGFQTFSRTPPFFTPDRIPPRGQVPPQSDRPTPPPAPAPAPAPSPAPAPAPAPAEEEKKPEDAGDEEDDGVQPIAEEGDTSTIGQRPKGQPDQPDLPAISREKINALKERKRRLQNYMTLLKETGRSPNGYLINQREIRNILNIVEMALTNVEQNTITDEEADYALSLYTAMDKSNALFSVAKAYYNVRGQGTVGVNDRLTLRETDELFINEGGRKAYKLYRNDKEIKDTTRNVPIYFNSDGDIYNNELDNKPQSTQPPTEAPAPEPDMPVIDTKPPDDTGITDERRQQLLEWRNNLYLTGRTPRGIINYLDNQISKALNDPNEITLLDRANGNIEATIAYLNLPSKDISQDNITSLTLTQVNEGFPKYSLRVNGAIAVDERARKRYEFNQYGDIYDVAIDDDFRPNLTYPFRPTSRDDLSVPPQSEFTETDPVPEEKPPTQTPPTQIPIDDAKLVLENRRDAVLSWAVPPENEGLRTTLLSNINTAIQYLEEGDKIQNIYVPILTNANYDVASAFAYLNAFTNSPNIPFLQPSDKISMTPSTNIQGAYFLMINNDKYDDEGDYILLNTGFGEKIKIKDMLIEGVSRTNPEGFQANDSFTTGRISALSGGLEGSISPTSYAIESLAQKAPEYLDIYKKLKGGN